MFDSGFLELLVITLIALIVVGPERLPGLARKAGELIGKARAFVANTKADIEKEIEATEMKDMLSQQKEQIEELRNMMASTKQSLNEGADNLKNSVNDAATEAKSNPTATNDTNTDVATTTDNTSTSSHSDSRSDSSKGNDKKS